LFVGHAAAPARCGYDAAMPAPTIDIACLCAAWCRLCDDYAKVVEQVKPGFDAPGVRLRWHWIDIEDEAELLGDLDIETFPTWVIADAEQVRFAGPVEPQPETLRRLLRATVSEAAPASEWPGVAREAEAFAARLRRRSDRV
jgi:thioredoxin 1